MVESWAGNYTRKTLLVIVMIMVVRKMVAFCVSICVYLLSSTLALVYSFSTMS